LQRKVARDNDDDDRMCVAVLQHANVQREANRDKWFQNRGVDK
jgi:hypothetical protein